MSWKTNSRRSIANRTSILGIMGGLANRRAPGGVSNNRATNKLVIPRSAAQGIAYMKMNNILSRNPVSGGVGKVVKSKSCGSCGIKQQQHSSSTAPVDGVACNCPVCDCASDSSAPSPTTPPADGTYVQEPTAPVATPPADGPHVHESPPLGATPPTYDPHDHVNLGAAARTRESVKQDMEGTNGGAHDALVAWRGELTNKKPDFVEVNAVHCAMSRNDLWISRGENYHPPGPAATELAGWYDAKSDMEQGAYSITSLLACAAPVFKFRGFPDISSGNLSDKGGDLSRVSETPFGVTSYQTDGDSSKWQTMNMQYGYMPFLLDASHELVFDGNYDATDALSRSQYFANKLDVVISPNGFKCKVGYTDADTAPSKPGGLRQYNCYGAFGGHDGGSTRVITPRLDPLKVPSGVAGDAMWTSGWTGLAPTTPGQLAVPAVPIWGEAWGDTRAGSKTAPTDYGYCSSRSDSGGGGCELWMTTTTAYGLGMQIYSAGWGTERGTPHAPANLYYYNQYGPTALSDGKAVYGDQSWYYNKGGANDVPWVNNGATVKTHRSGNTVGTGPTVAAGGAVMMGCGRCYSGYEIKKDAILGDHCVCAAGTYLPALMTACTAVQVCNAGTYISKPATPVSDAECGNCINGESFTDNNNESVCRTVKKCAAGEYVSAVATVSSDTVCTPCPSGSYQPSNTNTGGAASCVKFTVCEAGKKPSGTVPTTTGVTQNISCVPCANGYHKPAAGNGDCTINTVCGADYSVVPPIAKRTSAAGTPTMDTTCVACASDQWITPSAATQAGQQCYPLGPSTCASGSYREWPTATTPTLTPQCKLCAQGTFNDADDNSTACKEWTTCGAGKQPDPAQEGSSTADRVCNTCPDGHHKTQAEADADGGGVAPCKADTTCPVGYRNDAAATPTTDTKCIACAPGTTIPAGSDPGDQCTTNDPCPPGKHGKSGSCELCAAGTYSDTDGPQDCTPCPSGKYQDEEGQISCKTCDVETGGVVGITTASQADPTYAALGAAWCSHTGGSCINISGHTKSTHTESEGSFCCKGPGGMTSLDKDLGKCTEEGTTICSIVVGDPHCTVPNCA
jgi:hypothetical protein